MLSIGVKHNKNGYECKPSKKDLHLSVGLTGLFSVIGNSEQCIATEIPFVYSFSENCAAPQPQFPHSCVSERFIYIFPGSGPNIFLQQKRQIDRGNI
jgi:hypothetical protein